MKIRVAIVDDEPRAHKVLEAYIDKIPDITLVGSFLDPHSAYAFIKENPIDLVLLDITMPEVNGFAFLKKFDAPPMVIFTTAHPEFAFESYDYDAIDYLKKPIPYDRFTKAITKAIGVLSTKNMLTAPIATDIELKVDGETKRVAFDQIQYFQSLGNYVKVITDETTLITQITTTQLEAALPIELFIRIHKSYIVNRAKIVSLTEDDVKIGDSNLPIGKTFKRYVKDNLD